MKHQVQDLRIFKRLVGSLGRKGVSPLPPGRLVLEIGRFFLGASYASGTLEAVGPERLVVNLRKFDCFTFVENVVALTRLLRSEDRSSSHFRGLLREIRYRGGRLRGYPSRLHYFSEWIHDNRKKGFIRDVSAEAGGKPLRRVISFMTKNLDAYPALKDKDIYKRVRAIERMLSQRTIAVVPKKALRRQEEQIQDGDVIAIATNQEGLDVQHVGLAVRVRGRIHLLHASSLHGKVVLSHETLYRYLMRSRRRMGILVARVS
ncbi:MAG: DUF1460 domain-containing protein [Deltaproteobacteria bacterium]|nr:DUF1460 domain-containing protein [Deltaproteobacteria bacterium]